MDSAIRTPRVPYELLRPIFEHLASEKASLCAISLASSSFRDDAQRILFRDVTTLETYAVQIKFLRTVAASPTRLALFVRSYGQRWGGDAPSVEEFTKILPNVVGDGLKAMCRLKQLFITMYARLSGSHQAYIQILSECTFSLERFDWEALQQTSDELVEKFLSGQPTLKHLGLMYNASVADPLRLFPSTMYRQLVSVNMGWEMVKVLLPGRMISRIVLKDWDRDITDANIRPLAAELKRVTAFSTSFPLLRDTNVLDHGILSYFPFLNVLEIFCIDYHDEDHEYEDIYIRLLMPELSSIVSKLPALETLILSHPIIERDQQEDIEMTHHMFAKFGKHLKRIDIETGRKSYTRYIQSKEPVQISQEDVRKMWLTTS